MKKLFSILIICTIVLSSFIIVRADEQAPEVPQIRVTTANGNGNSLEKADGYTDAQISIKGLDNSLLEDAVSFKVRGNSTAMVGISKKAFTFKFSSKKDVLGMGKGKKWALLANTFDPTLMRNYIAFDLAKKLGIEYTSEQKVVELWVDNVFKGCYLLIEPVQAGSDRVDIDTKGNDGKKDFMIELEALREDEDVTYFKSSGYRFGISEPEEPDEEQTAYINGVIDDVFAALKSGDREQIEAKLDVESFAKFYIFNEFLKPLDVNFSSVFFFYKDGKLHAGPPWDYDLCQGNVSETFSNQSRRALDPENFYVREFHFFSRLTGFDWFREEAVKVFSENISLFQNIYTYGGVMDTFLSDYQNVISRNYNEAGWKVNRYWVNVQKVPLATYDENLDFLRDWLRTRTTWLANTYSITLPEEPQPTEPTTVTAEPTTVTAEPTTVTEATTETTQPVETTAPVTETTEAPYETGDINLDRSVNVKDATLLQMYLANLKTLSELQLSLSDVNRDGKINIKDATVIQKIAAKLI